MEEYNNRLDAFRVLENFNIVVDGGNFSLKDQPFDCGGYHDGWCRL